MATAHRMLDRTPDRPANPLGPPPDVLVIDVVVEEAHLANPVVAVARLLASEAQGFARVTGDERALRVDLALPADTADARSGAEAWVRWALHNAGVRGEVAVRPPA